MKLSTDQITARVINFVKHNPGCTAIELVCGIEEFGEDLALDLPTLLTNLVEDASLIEVKCVMPPVEICGTRLTAYCQIKSLFFIKDTQLEVMGSKADQTLTVFGCLANQENIGSREFPAGTSIRIIKN
jgi:hypothetical protein